MLSKLVDRLKCWYLQSPCCGKEYPCRLCHDESECHKIDRHTITEIKCRKCYFTQPVSDGVHMCTSLCVCVCVCARMCGNGTLCRSEIAMCLYIL